MTGSDIRIPGFFIALLLSFSSHGCRDSQSDPTTHESRKSPRLVAEPTLHVLGNIALDQAGEAIEVSTTLHNVGSAPLVIRKILASCSCTVPRPPNSSIPAGGEVTFQTRISLGRAGEARRTNIVIHGSDPDNPATKIEFEWRSLNPLVATPPSYRLTSLKPGATATGKIRLALTGIDFCDRCRLSVISYSRLIKPNTNLRKGTTSSTSHPSPVGSLLELGEVDFDLTGGDDLGDHRQQLMVKLQCESKVVASLSIPIEWQIRATHAFSPERLSLGSVKTGVPVPVKVIVRSTDQIPFHVLGVDSETSGLIKASRFDETSSISHVINLELNLPDADGPWRSRILIRTDSPSAHTLSFPVSGMIHR